MWVYGFIATDSQILGREPTSCRDQTCWWRLPATSWAFMIRTMTTNFTCLNIQLGESPNVCQQFMTRTETTEIFNSAGSVPASLRFAFGRRTCDLRGSMYPKGTTETATWRGANMTKSVPYLKPTPKLKRQHPCCLIWRGRGIPFLGGFSPSQETWPQLLRSKNNGD